MRVVVGMSGGVDSSVAAYLLKKQGYEVEGVSFILYEARLKSTFAGCCSVEAINDAQKTAEHIGVGHSRIDLRTGFMEKVIEPFIAAYSMGQTPNPCILCNRYIKFPSLLRIASERGADFIATGHYANIERIKNTEVRGQKSDNKNVFLKKGLDAKKDQSYVLYILNKEELNHLILPLGDREKEEVRGIAQALNLPAAKRPESQEICFIEDRSYCSFFKNIINPIEGPLIDIESGKVLGRHAGIHLFTIGQRKRLGIATGRPLFVARIDYKENAVYVGPKESAMAKECTIKDLNWLIDKESDFRATVKVRSMMKDEPASITVISDNEARVTFDEPQWAPAPGQSAVFYEGDIVIGGGVITN